MTKHFLIILLLLSLPNILNAQSIKNVNKIDEVLTRNVDVTGNGKQDKIVLHLWAKSINSPFSWTLSIVEDGKEIFSYSSNDSNEDKNFNDDGYVSDCRGYLECKKKYYFHDILENIVLTKNQYNVEGMLKSPSHVSIGKTYLEKCCTIHGSKADTILMNMEKKLRNGTAIVISIPVSPVMSGTPMVFAPEIGRFVPIYQD